MSAPNVANDLVVEVKQGDTLVLGCAAVDKLGAPVSLVGVTVSAQMRSLNGAANAIAPQALEVDFVSLVDGTFELWMPGTGRVSVAPAVYQVDVEYSAPVGGASTREMVRSSRTLFVRVLSGVTA
jgi:hypothetical protein